MIINNALRYRYRYFISNDDEQEYDNQTLEPTSYKSVKNDVFSFGDLFVPIKNQFTLGIIQTIFPFDTGIKYSIFINKNYNHLLDLKNIQNTDNNSNLSVDTSTIYDTSKEKSPTYKLFKSEYERIVHNLNRLARIFTGEKIHKPVISEADNIDTKMIEKNIITDDIVQEIASQTPVYESPKQKPQTKHILLIEDDYALSVFLKRALNRAGYEVTTANDGLEGKEKLELASYDLLITDLAMPGMDGIDLTKIAHKQYPNLPVLCMTGFPLIAENEDLDLTQIISKPFRLNELTDIVQNLLTTKMSEQHDGSSI